MMNSLSGRRGPRPTPHAIPRKPGVHLGTYRRLCREHEGVVRQLADLPERRLTPSGSRRLQTLYENRLARIKRALRLRVPGPRRKPRYRSGEAATLLGVSQKTLLRWVARGVAHCVRRGRGPRYFSSREIRRLTTIRPTLLWRRGIPR
jgi:hypothetical protein